MKFVNETLRDLLKPKEPDFKMKKVISKLKQMQDILYDDDYEPKNADWMVERGFGDYQMKDIYYFCYPTFDNHHLNTLIEILEQWEANKIFSSVGLILLKIELRRIVNKYGLVLNESVFKAKDEHIIMSELLQTDIENIPLLLEIYNDWIEAFYYGNDKLNSYPGSTEDKKIYYAMNDERLDKMPHIKSTGILGLKRNFLGWQEKRYSTNLMTTDLAEWLLWIQRKLSAFKRKVGKKYKINKNYGK